ncbi:uncharacterized protein LACBIDRAFT_302502 [Laccaria bicolor S238N-H82]|uniref:Predicted protein n=1 Tax=Laccaria bicolor (strain S238N-H82 / ATCC MYA-4686) TaxID=486041 RepID=B0DHS9_LACBS|nr:uncharacterized protein LACBIDRAFT_302502 [Laccaria bicolor S238N-H82]EDR05783.1 predicted protein [Laccaria bicolor S238N-H82]|eukprot:XP_001883459.1 predicted protein [Laccaria bicolor S238N-H82]
MQTSWFLLLQQAMTTLGCISNLLFHHIISTKIVLICFMKLPIANTSRWPSPGFKIFYSTTQQQLYLRSVRY